MVLAKIYRFFHKTKTIKGILRKKGSLILNKMDSKMIKSGIIFALTGVILGAFGAHGLEDILTSNDKTDVYNTAVRYQFYHAFALIIAGILDREFSHKFVSLSGKFFFAGILLFSGSLYIMAITNVSWLGMITPIGGLAFILGWIFLLLGMKKK
jgi:uncharacterized membrane protein YgdD (TMEM256/DUF423 family)